MTDTKLSIKQKIVKISKELRITKDGENKFANYNYFKPDDILKALNPLMEKYDLFMSFNLPYNDSKKMYEGTLYFEDLTDEKQNLTYKFDIPLTQVKGASEAQGAGATMTYCKRYSIQNAFGIADNSDDLDAKNPKDFISKDRTFPTSKDYGDVCPKCGSELKDKEGVKNGKHWQGQFCQNKNCKHVIWGPKIKDVEKGEQTLQHAIDTIQEEQFNERENCPPEFGG
jgi:hypothetical protein